MNKKNHLLTGIWYVLYPFLLYYAVMLIAFAIAKMLIGGKPQDYVFCQMLAAAVTIPVIIPFYRQDQALEGRERKAFSITKKNVYHILCAVIILACISIACNNLISMTKLVELSEGYQEANRDFYGNTLVWELISSAVFTPFLEELVFRGVIFGRLKKMLPAFGAVLLSSAIFAIMHFNIVQFIYAFLLGIVLALLVKKSANLSSAVAGHMCANAIAVFRTETGFLSATVKKNVFSWVFSVVLLLVGGVVLVLYLQKDKEE